MAGVRNYVIPVVASFLAVWSAADGRAATTPVPSQGVFAYELTMEGGNLSDQSLIQTVWFKGRKARIESRYPKLRMTEIFGPGEVLILVGDDGTAIRERWDGASNGSPIASFLEEVKRATRHGRRIGSEWIGRYKTDVYEQVLKSTDSDMTHRWWISPDVPVPVRMETVFSYSLRERLRILRMSGLPVIQNSRHRRTLRSVQMGAKIADSIFQLQKGTRIIGDPRPRRRRGIR